VFHIRPSIFVTVAVLAMACSAHATPPKYIFKDITPKTLNGYTVLGCRASAAAKNGLIAGQAYVTGLNRSVGWTYYNGQYQMIDHDFGQQVITVMGCNSAGQVVGYSEIPGQGERAFISRNGKFEVLPTGPNKDTEALGMNEAGDVVGFGWNQNDDTVPSPAVVWRNGNYHELDSTGKNGRIFGAALAVSSNGLIGGLTEDPSNGFRRACLWRDGVREFVGPEVTGEFSTAISAISDEGGLVGRAWRYDPASRRSRSEAFSIVDGQYRIFSKHGRQNSFARSFSGKGRLGGGVWNEENFQVTDSVSGIFEGQDFFPIKDLVHNPAEFPWEVRGFNFQLGSENIVGAYYDQWGNNQAFMAVPVPEPASMASALIIFLLRFREIYRRKP